MILTRTAPIVQQPFHLPNPDDRLEVLGFTLSSPGSFSKPYRTSSSNICIDVICGPDEIYDIIPILATSDTSHLSTDLVRAEVVSRINTDAILGSSMTKTAGTLGMPGGVGGMHNLNLPSTSPGPRWWPADLQQDDIDSLKSWIRDQYRYNPEYMAVGDALSSGKDIDHVVAEIPHQVSYARLAIDRQQPIVEYTTTDGKTGRQKISLNKGKGGIGHGDVAQEIDKYGLQVKPQDDGKGTKIILRKKDTRGDAKGIWQVNGPPSVPGFAYIDEDYRTGYGLHPELLDDPEWSSGKWMPGSQRWHNPFR